MKPHFLSSFLLVVAVTIAVLGSGTAVAQATIAASAPEPLTQERFEALQAEGGVVLVEVSASWCPTCARQKEILSAYRKARPGSPVHTLTVDFDTQKEWVRAFKAPRQSTLILFKGEEQVWFSVADTDHDRIFAALDEVAAGE